MLCCHIGIASCLSCIMAFQTCSQPKAKVFHCCLLCNTVEWLHCLYVPFLHSTFCLLCLAFFSVVHYKTPISFMLKMSCGSYCLIVSTTCTPLIWSLDFHHRTFSAMACHVMFCHSLNHWSQPFRFWNLIPILSAVLLSQSSTTKPSTGTLLTQAWQNY